MSGDSELRHRLDVVGNVYARSLALLAPLSSGDPTLPRFVPKRVAVRLLELCPEHGDAMIGLALFRAQRVSVNEHCLKTAIILANLASFLELPPSLALDTVLAGLLHHLGTDTHGPYAHNPGARAQRTLLSYLLNKTSTVSHYRQLLAASQHELGFDGTGVPRLDFPIRQHFVTHMLTVANDFAEFTSGRSQDPGSRDAISSQRALGLMTQAPGRRYHPVLVRALGRVVGPAPVGSIVILDDAREAQVTRYVPSGEGWSGHATLIQAPHTRVKLGSGLTPKVEAVRDVVPHLPRIAA